MDFFSSSPSLFLCVCVCCCCCYISPHFPGIKNPFWIIHSILNLAGTCIHNKLNLPRRLWDLSWTCRWQTTEILSFIFNGDRSSCVFKGGQSFYMNIDIRGWDLIVHFIQKRHLNPFHSKTDHSSELPPKRREVGSSFPHGYPGNEARKLDSRRQRLSAPYDMPQNHPRSPFRGAPNTPDYFCHLYFSLSLQSEFFFAGKKQLFFIAATRTLCNRLSSAVRGVICWNEARLVSRGLKCSRVIFGTAKLPFCGSKHNTWSNYEATITQARPDVIDRPSDRRVTGQMSGVKVQLLSNSVCICVCMHCGLFVLQRKTMLIHN